MKVEGKGKEFSPITITLETREEADLMWHMMNCGVDRSLMAYAGEKKLEEDWIFLKTEMWKCLDNSYTIPWGSRSGNE